MTNGKSSQMRKAKARRIAAARRSKRRGVLLLVVLSMLVLFMLVGTAFLMSSNQSRVAMKEAAKEDRLGNYATQLLERGLLQIVRDTDNPHSAIRYHSLLRDVYGTNGFQGVIYPADLNKSETGYLTRFAGATAGTLAQQLGPTNGQFIDIYVSQKPYNTATDYLLPYDTTVTPLDLKNVLKLDRNPYGQPQPYPLPSTKGYFNGCLLTMTSGPAVGQSARILEYEYVGDSTTTTPATHIFRFRVMGFQRADGQPLQINQTTGAKGRMPELMDLVDSTGNGQTFMVNGRAFSGTGVGYNPLAAPGQPRLSALQLFPLPAGNRYIGAELALLPNSVYFDPLSTITPVGAAPLTIQPDLTKPPILVDPFTTSLLLPATGPSTALQLQRLNDPKGVVVPGKPFLWYPSFPGAGGPNEGYDAPDMQNMSLGLQTVTPRSQGLVIHADTDPAKPPIALELSDSRILSETTQFLRLDIEDVPIPSFHRPDLANYWNHRLLQYLTTVGGLDPDEAVKAIVRPYADDKAVGSTVFQIDTTNTPNLKPTDAALISAIKRQTSLRPTREDHPHFDGSNPHSDRFSSQSVPGDLKPFRDFVKNGSITVPFWEVTGPWDVDNDNDGVRDSVWVDLGDPIQETEDGRRYKPLYAILCVDLDGRLNVNAHGQLADVSPPYLNTNTGALDPPMVGIVETPPGSGTFTAVEGAIESGLVVQSSGTPYSPQQRKFFSPGPNLAGSGSAFSNRTNGSRYMASGIGYGPADISLRPVFPIPWAANDGTLDLTGNRSEVTGTPVDSYRTLLMGRERYDLAAVPGRYGYESRAFENSNLNPRKSVSPGENYIGNQLVPGNAAAFIQAEDQRAPDRAMQIKNFEYPWSASNLSSFGTPPDLFGRYALGLDYLGQPVYEAQYDRNPNDPNPANLTHDPYQRMYAPLLTDAPYETDLSGANRRDSWASRTNSFDTNDHLTGNSASSQFNISLNQNDDAPYSATDLEKVLRGNDPDAGNLPSRLWDVVDNFDPVKLGNFDTRHVAGVTTNVFGINNPKTTDPEFIITAQQIAGISRRLVTTDSYTLPVANQTMPGYVSEFGADGRPGRRKKDSDPPEALNTPISDDFQVVMAARDGLPISQAVSRSQAKISDLLYYRIWLEARKHVMRAQGLVERGVGGIDPDSNGNGGLSPADYQSFSLLVTNRAKAVFNGVAGVIPPAPAELLAPEVLAGNRMDLNRPFGDGFDSKNPFTGLVDGVVDDPMEAGEPFLDVNGNGKMDYNGTTPAEPFIDVNGDGKYQEPTDQLWVNLMNEFISFDYTNGYGGPLQIVLRKAVENAPSINRLVLGGVRNLESQGRQVYARHLYCLMLLLMDENYIAPWDENDPQLATWILTTKKPIQAILKANYVAAGMVAKDADKTAWAEADFIVKRKLTCKMIAQWAVNCVDMRDSDVIMTPFEYDENPWDGWGVWSDTWVGEGPGATPNFVKTKTDLTKATFIPLDGDPATNENDAWMIDWTKSLPPSGGPKTLVQLGVNPNQPVDTSTTPPPNPPIITHPFNQTRGVVWGAERPELLITETLAFHDRHTEDLKSPDSSDGHDVFKPGTVVPTRPQAAGTLKYYPDTDLDQGLRPQGSAFVELYNPWSPKGQLPAELYSRLDVSTGYKYNPDPTAAPGGVDLGRLSNFAWDDVKNCLTALPTDISPGKSIRRSPVWRLIVVEEWPNARKTGDAIKDEHADLDAYPKKPAGAATAPLVNPYYQDVADRLDKWGKPVPPAIVPDGPPPWVPTNPDFDPQFGSDMLQQPGHTKLVGSGFDPPVEKQVGNANKFAVTYPNFEREFYFTTDKSDARMDTTLGTLEWSFTRDTTHHSVNDRATYLKVRIPDRAIHIGDLNSIEYAQTQRFIPPALELSNLTKPVIAPIKPGRYAVVGSAGTNYQVDPADEVNIKAPDKQLYTTTIGRTRIRGVNKQLDKDHQIDVFNHGVRLIEMRPSTNPERQQLVVGSNGGDPKDASIKSYDPYAVEIGRDNEIIRNDKLNKLDNITTPELDTAAVNPGGARYYQPCVAIPVDGMNVSEPPWGYGPRETEALAQEKAIRKLYGLSENITAPIYKRYGDHREGRYSRSASTSDDSFDKPLDTAPELTRTGTTANYRMFHLQRLANPLLPWNPPQMLADGKTENPEWKKNMPINPYVTVDSASVNLTAFNGASDSEDNLDAGTKAKLFTYCPWRDTAGATLDSYWDSLDKGNQAWFFRSQERGFWSRLNLVGSNPAGPTPPPVTTLPQRVLWAQEPATVLLKRYNTNVMHASTLIDLIEGRQISMGENEVDPDVLAAQNISDNYVNMVMEHSLGFGNESFGLLYDKMGAKLANNPTAARPTGWKSPTTSAAPRPELRDLVAGAPAPTRFIFMHDPLETTDPNSLGTPKHDLTNVDDLMKVESTNPWLAWDNRPYVSAEELLKVPAASQSQMLRQYATIDPTAPDTSRPNSYGLVSSVPDSIHLGSKQFPVKNVLRWKVMQSVFGNLANVFAASAEQFSTTLGTLYLPNVADVVRDANGAPSLYGKNNEPITDTTVDPYSKPEEIKSISPYGAPNFSRILEYVQVPSRFVGTDTVLTAETFNDVPKTISTTEPIGLDMSPAQLTALGTTDYDPRYHFQPPFNKVSRERDPGMVNLNTVTGRRTPPATPAGAAQIWSEVYDGIMHRFRDGNLASQSQLGHFGPAWRDVVLSRRGYVQFDAGSATPLEKPSATAPPDTLQFGLNNNFPSVFSNPFRSPDAGDLVPLVQMMQFGVDASMQRVHPRNRGVIFDTNNKPVNYDSKFGNSPPTATAFGDARDAGFGNDGVSYRTNSGAIPNDSLPPMPVTKATPPPTLTDVLPHRDTIPLFSDVRADVLTDQNGNKYWGDQPFTDTNRNPSMMYEPMSRLGSLVTNRSGVYAVWITVGYFEVEKAPDWNDPDTTTRNNIQAHFANDQSLYNRAYPDGYMLGKELGSETGDVKRPRGFYIIDRTEEVGFKPGEDLNVEKTIRLRRRID